MFIYNEAWSSRHCSCQEGDNFCLMTGHHHIYTFIKINETWKDGACRRCKCYASKPTKDCPGIKHIHYKYIYSKTLSDKPPHASCSVQRCDNRQVSKDQGRYVLEPEYTPGVCCPDYKKVACKDGENVYQVKISKIYSEKNAFISTDWRKLEV